MFAGRPINIPEMIAHLKKTAEDLGLPFGNRKMTYNSRLAQELGKWAESLGKGDQYHHSVFKAYFADGLNIGSTEVLEQLAQDAGLPGNEIRSILAHRTFESAVDSDWSRARKFGITAVPTFMVKQRILVGAQPYEVLEGFLESNQVVKRNTI
jgi:predicted DsbA family dithiol-disulfide isomerase